MSHIALVLVLISAVAHATWNLIAKHVASGLAFQWLFTVLSAVIYVPVVVVLVVTGRTYLDGGVLILMLGTAALHVIYFALLNRGYQSGDLSLVYPLARGSGPLLATGAAIALRGERPSPLALAAVLLIGIGIVLLTGNPRVLWRSKARLAVMYALLTGVTIAAYTVWDKTAVSNARLSPAYYYWSATAIEALVLTPLVLRSRKQRDMVRAIWQTHRAAAAGVAVLSPLAYVLVLTALATTPIYFVAPVREIGILIGALMGAHFLAEGERGRRLVAATLLVIGVATLALS